MASASTTDGDTTIDIDYTYDINGLRTSKTIARTTTTDSGDDGGDEGGTGGGSQVPICTHNYVEVERTQYMITYQCTLCNAIYQEPIQQSGAYNLLNSNITVTAEHHEYVYASGQLLREVITTTDAEGNTTTQTLDFTYDASGNPYTLTYTKTYTNGTANPVTRYYMVNLQGDVMRLVSASGATVAEYWYNPYGEVVTASGSMAEVNPLRYLGYCCDAETEFYYLQSRYYDPAICRFVNADGIATTGQGFLGYNMFAYCGNNPTNNIDVSGYATQNITAVYCDGGTGLSPDELRILRKIQELDPRMSDFDPLDYEGCTITTRELVVDVSDITLTLIGSNGPVFPILFDTGVGTIASVAAGSVSILGGIFLGIGTAVISESIRGCCERHYICQYA